MSDDGNQTCAIDDAAENRSRFRERLQHRSGLWFILVLAVDQQKDVRVDISEPGLGGLATFTKVCCARRLPFVASLIAGRIRASRIVILMVRVLANPV